jgi:DNA-binding NarL/FixJ family response regulator
VVTGSSDLLPSTRLDGLSPYQRRVLELMARGMSNVAIAGHLGVSRRAVENQVSRLMRALGLARTDDAVAARVCAVLLYLGETGFLGEAGAIPGAGTGLD